MVKCPPKKGGVIISEVNFTMNEQRKYEVRQNVIDLYRTQYYDANFEHYTELLDSFEGMNLSSSTAASIEM